ncbi:uncharacterized protein LOC141618508 [Silene latifolia]|uniref:uncharacterized protein LOC141618508 n=1 Tax=Silene latifolia TaxID=37657 RepID=UPI003D777DF7
MNKNKSCMYGNGISRGSLEELCQLAGIPAGNLPFKYLEVPIIAKWLAASDCAKLVERVVERIRAIGARKLSYAGRLVLIKYVLSTLYCYSARIFVLPVSILNKVEALCRSFLWQAEGGLGIKDLRRWNTAALGKYIWWLAQKQDRLWVKWIHAVYMKNGDWHSYTPKVGASWAWRKLYGIKEKLKSGYVEEWWLSLENCYSVQQGYQWLGVQVTKVDWVPFVWNNISLPKYCFLGWLVVHGRLLTKDRLKKMQICADIGCVLCGREDESHKHIFFECVYSKICLGLLNQLLNVSIPTSEFIQWWLKKRFKSLLRKKLVAAGMQALLYRIWEQRNKCRMEERLARPEVLIWAVKSDILIRMQVMQRKRPINEDYRKWIN